MRRTQRTLTTKPCHLPEEDIEEDNEEDMEEGIEEDTNKDMEETI